jgi:hypothetical protein
VRRHVTSLLQMALVTPCAWLSVYPAFVSSPYWLLFGAAGLILRYVAGTYVYLLYSATQAGRGAGYIATLRQRGYRGPLRPFDQLFPAVASRYSSNCQIHVKVARAPDGVPPLTHYCAYTMPAYGTAIVIISDEPEKLGDVLYLQALHEIGHALFSGQSHSMNQTAPGLMTAVVYGPLLLMVNYWPFKLAVASLAVWHYYVEQSADFAEISADQFALQAFEDTRGRTARSKAVRALLAYWSNAMTGERVQRAPYLLKPVGYAPDAADVARFDRLRQSGPTDEVAADQVNVQILQKVNRGPVALASLLVIGFWSLQDHLAITQQPASLALASVAALCPTICIFLFLAWQANREARRQSLNVAWILATADVREP